MASKAAAPAHQPNPAPSEPSRLSELVGTMRRRLPLAGFLLAIVGVQAAVSYLLAPVAAEGEHAGSTVSMTEGDDAADLVDVEIDEFHCTNSLAEPGVRIGLSFKTVGSVSRQQADLLRDAVTTSRKYRIREAVVRAVRNCGRDELSEPELVKLRRLVKNEINRVLPADYVHAVQLLDFKQTPQ